MWGECIEGWFIRLSIVHICRENRTGEMDTGLIDQNADYTPF
jgi:hypothetical protein